MATVTRTTPEERGKKLVLIPDLHSDRAWHKQMLLACELSGGVYLATFNNEKRAIPNAQL
jgi:hypothetical protein